MNNKNNTLSKHGKFWASFLNIVDSSKGVHLFKSLNMKTKRDEEACMRINSIQDARIKTDKTIF